MSGEQYGIAGDTIPPALRRALYVGYVLAGLVAGAVQAYVAAIGGAQPEWLTGTLAVLAFAAVPITGLAGVYTNRPPTAVIEGEVLEVADEPTAEPPGQHLYVDEDVSWKRQDPLPPMH